MERVLNFLYEVSFIPFINIKRKEIVRKEEKKINKEKKHIGVKKK